MKERYIFRVLRADEEIKHGIVAKNPESNMQLSKFIRFGSRKSIKSQFIATTTNFATAYNWANEDVTKRNIPLEEVRIAIIDATMLDDCEIFDMSTRESGERVFSQRSDEPYDIHGKYIDITLKYSTHSSEVDIVGTIRRDAFTVFGLAEIRTAMNTLLKRPIPGGVVSYLMEEKHGLQGI